MNNTYIREFILYFAVQYYYDHQHFDGRTKSVEVDTSSRLRLISSFRTYCFAAAYAWYVHLKCSQSKKMLRKIKSGSSERLGIGCTQHTRHMPLAT